MRAFIKIGTTLSLLFILTTIASAQVKINANAKVVHLAEDSLLIELNNTIYHTYYAAYRKDNTTYTMLKVDIDWEGKVTGMNFSDSADQTFVDAWVNKKVPYDANATLERYAKIKGYKSTSLLIPINYQYGYPVKQKNLTVNERDGLMNFGKRPFKGSAVLLEPIKISVLKEGDM